MPYIKALAWDTGSEQKGQTLHSKRLELGTISKIWILQIFYSAKCGLIQKTSGQMSILGPGFRNPSIAITSMDPGVKIASRLCH